MSQQEFEFAKVFEPSKLVREEMCVMSTQDLKNHVLGFVKLFCTSVCERNSCKGCPVEELRLFVSRMPASKFYAAPLEGNVPLVYTEGEPMPESVQMELEMTTARFGVAAFLDAAQVRELVDRGIGKSPVVEED